MTPRARSDGPVDGRDDEPAEEDRLDSDVPTRDIREDEADPTTEGLARVAQGLRNLADGLSIPESLPAPAAPSPDVEPEPVAVAEPDPGPDLISEPVAVPQPEPTRIPDAETTRVIPVPVIPRPAPQAEEPEIEEFVFPQNRAETFPESGESVSRRARKEPRTRPPLGTPKHLSRRRFAAVAAFADALLPPGGDLPLSASEAGVAERVDASMPALDPDVRRNLQRLITIVDLAPLPTRGRRLSRMSTASATAYVEKALGSRKTLVRTAYNLLKLVAVNEFASTPRIEEAIGFTYGCVTRDPPRDGPALEVIAYPVIDRDHVEECDVVVVGSGAGGAAVAKELAESGLSVIVVEEGAYYTRSDFAGPPWERVRRLYRANGTTVALGKPVIPLPVGKAVGGTTLVNAGTCFRTPDRVLKAWESEFGIQGLDTATMRPIFERVERILHVQPVPEEIIGDNARIFRRGVEALGLHGTPIERNIAGCRGCGVCVFGCPSDAKQSTHISYLPRAQRAGASIYARCRVERIIVAGGRARGVVARMMDEAGVPQTTLTVRSKAVVVAAGALHTPALLAANALAGRSGMLGRNLRIHPATALGAVFDEPVYSWRGTLQSFYVDDWHDTEDIMIEVTSSVPGVAAGSLPGAGPQLASLLARMSHIASAGLFVSDTSSGRVRRRRHGEPLVTYTLNEHDTRRMVDGMARIAEIFLAAGARSVFTGVPSIPWISGPRDVETLRERGVRTAALKLTAFHPVGTARMGADPSETVVDPWGECHDVPGLFVADASVLPGCPTVNPQVTIMAFATRTAAHMLKTRTALFG